MKKSCGKKFILKVISSVLMLLVITAFVGYIIDPAMYYRIPKYKAYCTEIYTTAGLIKNSEATIAVIGSSMMQNTDLDLVERCFGTKAVKYTRSGMNNDEIVMLVNRAIETENNINKFIINLDISTFNSDKTSPYSKLPEYMYDNSKGNDFKYLLGYDTWSKLIPFNLVYNLCTLMDNSLGIKIQEKFERVMDIDLMGDWSVGTEFSKERVISNYNSGIASVSTQNTEAMVNRMKDRFDKDFYPIFEQNSDKEFVFVFPPYSALMWFNAEQEGYLNALLEFKKYIVERFSNLPNVDLFDFQDYPLIVDLNNYKDTTHYKPEFNDKMIEYISNGINEINYNNVDERILKLKYLLDEFKLNEKSWLN